MLDRHRSFAVQHNTRAWDRLARHNHRFTRPIDDDDFSRLATRGWLRGHLRGKRVLCLAAGGGRQGPVYAAAGARVTVVDISAEQLACDRAVAAERRLHLHTVQTSMDDLSMFGRASFDIVVQPVSTCYVPDVRPVYREVARVTSPGGLYISQHKQPGSLQAAAEGADGYLLHQPYYRSGPLPPQTPTLVREEGTWEYLHRWEQLLGEMCRAGFTIEDLHEPYHARPSAPPGTFAHRCYYLAPYVCVKARRTTSAQPPLLLVP